MSKPIFASGSPEEQTKTRATLAHVLETTLRALHPYLPFITEELWQKLPRPANRPISIALAPYPTRADGRVNAEAEKQMDQLMAAIVAARTVRSEHEIHPTAQMQVVLRSSDAAVRKLLESQS